MRPPRICCCRDTRSPRSRAGGGSAAVRFASVSPHPFWVVVLLIAAQYGTGEALVAAALSGAALLINNLPEQGFNEDLYAWLLRISFNPVLWCIAAVALGEIRAGHKRQA